MTMSSQDLVQQYVERQRAYIPTYTTENEYRAPQSNLGFGFDTPVLRPRKPVKPQLAGLADEGSDARGHIKEKARNKHKKGASPSDDEHAARLAARRDRKRKRRAIMSPPKQDKQENARQRKGKAKKPAALALMYGFTATNVTKDRLTLKPAPSLGVFSKGKASAKKKVTTTKKSSSKNELFCESAFLNRPSERTDGLSETDEDEPRVTNHAKKDRGEATALKTPSGGPTRTTAESEIWDIEMQSRLPSSARDVSSEPETKGSAPAVLDLRGAEWSTSIKVAEKRQDEFRMSNLSLAQSRPRIELIGSPPARSLHAADVSSIHPSHSASQVGHRDRDIPVPDLRPIMSKYFAEPGPIFEQRLIPNSEPVMEPNNDMGMLGVEDQDANAEVDERTINRTASPISILPNMTEFRTWYDTGNDCPCEECWRGANVPSELIGGSDPGYFDPTVQERFLIEDESDAWDEGEYEEDYDLLEPEYEYEEEPADEPSMESVCGDFLEGRALLRGVEGAGWGGLGEAERDVASQLRYHWLPLRL